MRFFADNSDLKIASEGGIKMIDTQAVIIALQAERDELRAKLSEISDAFPDSAPHKHPETGVSLYDDVRDLIRDKQREYERAEANWKQVAVLQHMCIARNNDLIEERAQLAAAGERERGFKETFQKLKTKIFGESGVSGLLGNGHGAHFACSSVRRWHKDPSCDIEGDLLKAEENITRNHDIICSMADLIDAALAQPAERTEGERTDTERLDHLENEVDREMRDVNPKGYVSLFRRNVPITRESIDDDMEVPRG